MYLNHLLVHNTVKAGYLMKSSEPEWAITQLCTNIGNLVATNHCNILGLVSDLRELILPSIT